MQIFTTQARKLAAAAALAVTSSQVLAGGSVGHIPASESVPMLGGVGLVVLAGLLGLVAVRFMKDSNRSGGQFLMLAIAASALASGGSGIKLINDAYADASVQLSDSSGGVVTIPFPGFHEVFNNTGVPQQINDIDLNPGYSLQEIFIRSGNGGNRGGSLEGQCDDKPSTVLAPGGSCEMQVCCGNGGCPI
ncbi:MAG: hypothetical protein ACI9JM_000448 [Halioglobus sp.]|jgi:hypothetical protein